MYSIRSHTPDVMSRSKPPEIPVYHKHSPPTVPRHGSPGVSRWQLAVDNSTPPTLPPKKNQQVEYAEVPVSFVNIHSTTGADLDWSQVNAINYIVLSVCMNYNCDWVQMYVLHESFNNSAHAPSQYMEIFISTYLGDNYNH